MSGSRQAYVALGSNLGDRRKTLVSALAALAHEEGMRTLACSRVYETEPEGPPQERYLNAVVRLETFLAPRALLGRLLAIEVSHGRRRGPTRNAPRTLDLDLLLHGDDCLDATDLVLPHPRMHLRAFVLEPLCELAPQLVHPRLGRTIRELAAGVRDPARVRVLEDPWPG
ncbi:MAG: 2-amino-4-hydroxy-6-hydroxymethyldihydropteridine diphosphokinase [Myxococcota bacterium]